MNAIAVGGVCQGRSQDFSEVVSQDPRRQLKAWLRGLCDARAHVSSTQMLASFPIPGLLPPELHCAQCASEILIMQRRKFRIAREGRSRNEATQ